MSWDRFNDQFYETTWERNARLRAQREARLRKEREEAPPPVEKAPQPTPKDPSAA